MTEPADGSAAATEGVGEPGQEVQPAGGVKGATGTGWKGAAMAVFDGIGSFFKSVWNGLKSWVPSPAGLVGLVIWAGLSAVFIWVVVPAWASNVKEESCHAPPTLGGPVSTAMLGAPPSGATLSPGVSIARGAGSDATSWAAGPGAPNVTFLAKSSPLLRGGGGTPIPSTAITNWVSIDNGTVIVTSCVDSGAQGVPHLTSGTYAGFAVIPVSDSNTAVTVREQFQVQAYYIADFWPLGILIVAFAIALSGQLPDKAAKRWLIFVTGTGTFVGTYYATALANPSWGGPKSIGTLLAAVFTATTGAVATVAKGTS